MCAAASVLSIASVNCSSVMAAEVMAAGCRYLDSFADPFLGGKFEKNGYRVVAVGQGDDRAFGPRHLDPRQPQLGQRQKVRLTGEVGRGQGALDRRRRGSRPRAAA